MTKIIELEEDNAEIIERLLHYLYTLNYEDVKELGEEDASTSIREPTASVGISHYLSSDMPRIPRHISFFSIPSIPWSGVVLSCL